jgi:predicted transcriptional regulator
MTLTIDLPEDVAAKMEQIPEAQRERYAIALLRRSLIQDAPTQQELAAAGYASRADFEDACAGIAEGIADAEAGRTLSWEEAQEEWAAARTAWRQSRRGK